MNGADSADRRFGESVAATYQTLLVPMIFAPYADDLAARARRLAPRRVLEVACGTGVVTRALDAALDPEATIVATDLNPAMLAQAQREGTTRALAWREADAQALPFDDATFDLVVCQFGVMFFPDRPRAFAEARRVLGPGGSFLFNSWDRIEANDFADVVTRALADWCPEDPPRFLARTPHGYHDAEAVGRDVAAGGFGKSPRIEFVDGRSPAASAAAAASAYCEGTPLRAEIEARRPGRLAEPTGVAATALAARFGDGPIDGRLRALVCHAKR
jgi:SAM-dependent methyltransferase